VGTAAQVGLDEMAAASDGALRAGRYARAAADAAVFPQHQLGRHDLALGVVTPPAAQRTSLEENGGPNPRPIVDGELFDVEDDAFSQ
jgi:hypothetical protein